MVDLVEILPLRVAGQLAFKVLNVLRVIRSVDEARSEFIEWTRNDGGGNSFGTVGCWCPSILDGHFTVSNGAPAGT